MTLLAANQPMISAPSESDVVLSVQGVSKKFCRDFKKALFYGMQDISSEVMGLRGDKNDKLRKKEFWALQDVSFELRRGEALGLVGKNGSGKSTLLRIIAGLIKPDVGSVAIKGRVAPLIALGAGFNPVLTGRENIYANMSILGLSKDEIDDRFDDVVAFAEIPDAIDSPVRSYSSGMQARLGFACAIHTDPDILLVDEVLAVGDIKFRSKCHRKLDELQKRGVAFILVSHQSQTVLNICSMAAYLKQGILVQAGKVDEVFRTYDKDLFEFSFKDGSSTVNFPKKIDSESTGLDISYLLFRNLSGAVANDVKTGDHCYFCIGYIATKQIDEITINITVKEIAGEGEAVFFMSSISDEYLYEVKPGSGEFVVDLPYLCIRPGAYTMKVAIRRGRLYALDIIEHYQFRVTGMPGNYLIYQPRKWRSNQEIDAS